LASVISGDSVQWPVTLVATLVAFVVGYWVIATLMRYLNTGSFMPFVIYRIALGLALMAWLYFGNNPGALPTT
ncbi:MAG: hypothetical protein EBR84_03075, partial [Actinobacteria bacterium]|nr:hypothetical protein [Actinomycetota bacterium]